MSCYGFSSEVLIFQLRVTGLHGLVDSNPKALSEDDIIQKLKTKFQYFKAQ